MLRDWLKRLFLPRPVVAGRGRNAPCPCGSGRKYKRCCLVADEEQLRGERNASADANRPGFVGGRASVANRALERMNRHRRLGS